MKKELKDYLHLYLGCDVLIPQNGVTNKLVAIVGNPNEEIILETAIILKVKPLLRRLEDMTEYEVIELIYKRSTIYLNVCLKSIKYGGVIFEFEYASSKRRRWETQKISELNPDQFAYLLSIGIDLFNLIPEGLALSK